MCGFEFRESPKYGIEGHFHSSMALSGAEKPRRIPQCSRNCSGQSLQEPQESTGIGMEAVSRSIKITYFHSISTGFNKRSDLVWDQRIGGSNPSAPTIADFSLPLFQRIFAQASCETWSESAMFHCVQEATLSSKNPVKAGMPQRLKRRAGSFLVMPGAFLSCLEPCHAWSLVMPGAWTLPSMWCRSGLLRTHRGGRTRGAGWRGK